MNTQKLLNQYQQLDQLTEQMLITVKNDEWDKLPGLQAQYEQLSQELQNCADVTDKLTMSESEVISSHIMRILSHQQQLKQLISLHRTKLGKLIGETVNQRTQINSYHQVATLI